MLHGPGPDIPITTDVLLDCARTVARPSCWTEEEPSASAGHAGLILPDPDSPVVTSPQALPLFALTRGKVILLG